MNFCVLVCIHLYRKLSKPAKMSKLMLEIFLFQHASTLVRMQICYHTYRKHSTWLISLILNVQKTTSLCVSQQVQVQVSCYMSKKVPMNALCWQWRMDILFSKLSMAQVRSCVSLIKLLTKLSVWATLTLSIWCARVIEQRKRKMGHTLLYW